MSSPIVEPGNLGDTIKIKALSREPGNPGCAVISVRRRLLFMRDLYDIQFQPILQENLENNRVRIMNNREWTEEQKDRIVEIDHKE